MGKARILSAQGEGLYSIEILEDRTRAESLKQRALQRIDEIDSELTTLEADLEQARQKVDDAAEAQDQAIQQHQDEIAATGESSVDLQAPAQAVLEADAARDAIRTRIGSLNLERLQQQGWIDRVDALPPLRTQQAWCADYTEDLSGEVATAEVPGEAKQVIIKPGFEGANQWSASEDGAMQPALASTPAGVFYNLAMMPGWQKWRPTFRVATISNINEDLCDITLDAATSSQQALNVNAQGSYSGVPIYYMDCNGAAFEDGDRVLVAFSGNTDQPMVVGFESEPKECTGFSGFSGVAEFLHKDYLPLPEGTTRSGPREWMGVITPCPLPELSGRTDAFLGSYSGAFSTALAVPITIAIVSSEASGIGFWIREDMLDYAASEMHRVVYDENGIDCSVSARTEHETQASLEAYHEFTIIYTLNLSGGTIKESVMDGLKFSVSSKRWYAADRQFSTFFDEATQKQYCQVSTDIRNSPSFEVVLPNSEVVYFDSYPTELRLDDAVSVVMSEHGVLFVTLSIRRFDAGPRSGLGRYYILYAVAPDGQQALCDYSGFWQSEIDITEEEGFLPPPAGRPFTFERDKEGNWAPLYA